MRGFRFFARRLSENDGPAPLDGLQMRLLWKRDLPALCRDAALELQEQSAMAAYARGQLCVAAYDGDVLAGYCWLAFAPLHHLDGVWVRFGPEVSWTYKSFVRPSHIGFGIAPALYRFADRVSLERDCTTSVICAAAREDPSAGAALRAGYAAAGWAAYLRASGWLLDWYSDAVRQYGVAFFIPKPGRS